MSRAETDNLLGGGATTAVSTSATLPTRDYTTVVTWTHNFGSRIVNQARAQFVPNNSAQTIPKAPGTTSLILPGVGSFGRDFATPFNTFQDRYQFEDTVAWALNKHNVKFGGSYRYVNYEVINELWFCGRMDVLSRQISGDPCRTCGRQGRVCRV